MPIAQTLKPTWHGAPNPINATKHSAQHSLLYTKFGFIIHSVRCVHRICSSKNETNDHHHSINSINTAVRSKRKISTPKTTNYIVCLFAFRLCSCFGDSSNEFCASHVYRCLVMAVGSRALGQVIVHWMHLFYICVRDRYKIAKQNLCAVQMATGGNLYARPHANAFIDAFVLLCTACSQCRYCH